MAALLSKHRQVDISSGDSTDLIGSSEALLKNIVANGASARSWSCRETRNS